MNLKLNKDKLTRVAIKILAMKLSTTNKKNKKTGLTEEDITMFNRIFNSPINREVEYQYHHYLDEDWQKSHRRMKSNIRK